MEIFHFVFSYDVFQHFDLPFRKFLKVFSKNQFSVPNQVSFLQIRSKSEDLNVSKMVT